jgi:hypothetical protein
MELLNTSYPRAILDKPVWASGKLGARVMVNRLKINIGLFGVLSAFDFAATIAPIAFSNYLSKPLLVVGP